MANISQFNRESQQRIADVVRRVEQSPPAPSQRGHRITPHAKEVRWGVTATTYEHPTYPNSGPVYGVKLGELVPSPDPPYPGATITKSLVPYDPAVEIVATDPDGGTWEEGSTVRVERHDGRWWIRPASTAGSTYVVPADVYGTVGANRIYQDGASSADTSPYQITSSGLWCFPNLEGVTTNSIGSSIIRNTPSTYSTEWITLYQATAYIVEVYTAWALPSLSLSDARTLFRAAAHDHAYTDDGAPMTTGAATPDARGLSDGGVVSVTTYLRQTNVNSGFGDNWMGTSSLRPFYDAGGGVHYANHCSVYRILNNSYRNSLRIKVVRDDSTSYVAPELHALRIHIRQSDPCVEGPAT